MDGLIGQPVALKVIHGELTRNLAFVHVLVEQCRQSMTLSHRNIARVLDVCEQLGTYFIVSEYVHGISLQDLLKGADGAGRALEPELALFVGSEICRALAHAHEHRNARNEPAPFFYRDLTPTSVLVSLTGEVKITDFGLAHVRGRLQPARISARARAAYQAPEVARGEPADPRSDVFSIGVLLYQLLTGEHPAGPAGPSDGGRWYEDKLRRPPSAANAQISGELDEVILRCLEPTPSGRWNDANVVLNALSNAVLFGAPLDADPAAQLARFMTERAPALAQTMPPAAGSALPRREEPGSKVAEPTGPSSDSGSKSPSDERLTVSNFEAITSHDRIENEDFQHEDGSATTRAPRPDLQTTQTSSVDRVQYLDFSEITEESNESATAPPVRLWRSVSTQGSSLAVRVAPDTENTGGAFSSITIAAPALPPTGESSDGVLTPTNLSPMPSLEGSRSDEVTTADVLWSPKLKSSWSALVEPSDESLLKPHFQTPSPISTAMPTEGANLGGAPQVRAHEARTPQKSGRKFEFPKPLPPPVHAITEETETGLPVSVFAGIQAGNAPVSVKASNARPTPVVDGPPAEKSAVPETPIIVGTPLEASAPPPSPAHPSPEHPSTAQERPPPKITPQEARASQTSLAPVKARDATERVRQQRSVVWLAAAVGLFALGSTVGALVFPRLRHSSLEIATIPEGAEVILNGEAYAKKTPFSIEVDAQTPIDIALQLEGYEPIERKLTGLGFGEKQSLTVALSRVVPTLRISPVPGRVFLNGAEVGRGETVRIVGLDPEEAVQIRVEAPEHEPFEAHWARGSRVPAELKINLRRK